MENTIFYFTGTGNSLKVSKDIAAKISGTNIVSIALSMDNITNLAPKGSVGFVFPVYYCGLPKLVVEFISAIDLSQADYIYTVATYGKAGGNAGCISQPKKILRNKNKKLNAAFYVKCIDNWVLSWWDVTKERQHSTVHKKALKKTERIATIVSAKKNYKDISITERTGKVMFGYNRFYKTVNISDKSFTYSGECNGCGLCSDVCPVDNIKKDNGRPIWKSESCQLCLACYHLCPRKCIEYSNKTKKKSRYKNPYIEISDLRRRK